jgi:hypothetical protein
MSNITHMVLGLPWPTSRLFWRESLAMRPSSQGKIGIGPWVLIFHLCAYTDYIYIYTNIYIYQFLVCIHVHMHIYAYPQSSLRNAAQLNWDWPWPSPDWWVLTTPPTLAPNMPKATEVSGGKTTAKNRIHLTLAQWKKNKIHKHPESYHLGCIYIYLCVWWFVFYRPFTLKMASSTTYNSVRGQRGHAGGGSFLQRDARARYQAWKTSHPHMNSYN